MIFVTLDSLGLTVVVYVPLVSSVLATTVLMALVLVTVMMALLVFSVILATVVSLVPSVRNVSIVVSMENATTVFLVMDHVFVRMAGPEARVISVHLDILVLSVKLALVTVKTAVLAMRV